jgi:hypothetical protein
MLMNRKKVSLTKIKGILGHERLKTTKRHYLGMSPDRGKGQWIIK